MAELNAAIRDIPLPKRMRHLPINDRGFPVPWFVAWPDGKPDFRVIDTPKVAEATKRKLCFLCGDHLGKYMSFVIGPMCAVNRVSSEPPCHTDCAEYAVRACPFLTQPRMRRNDSDYPEGHKEPGGIMITRNPGVSLIWTTLDYKVVRDGRGGWIIQIGEPQRVQWIAKGRAATRDEVMDSISTGFPLLQDMARKQGAEAEKDLAWQYDRAMKLVPA